MIFDAVSTLTTMYSGNPVLTLLIFGLPGSFLAIIIYMTCCSDIMDRSDNYEDDEDGDEEDDEENKDGQGKMGAKGSDNEQRDDGGRPLSHSASSSFGQGNIRKRTKGTN